MGEIKAIQTEYNGFKFRSRAEARWAVFFDACGIEWEYEPEGFELEDGTMYLPDFLLHNVYLRSTENNNDLIDLWVEVKGFGRMTEEDAHKIELFNSEPYFYSWDGGVNGYMSRRIIHPMFVVSSKMPNPANNDIWGMQFYEKEVSFYSFCYADGDDYPAVLVATTDQRGALTQYEAVGEERGKKIDFALTDAAYEIALKARFEHGETMTKTEVQNKARGFTKRRTI